MRGYLAALKNTDLVVKRWVLDTKLALDQLPKADAPGRLAARLDLSRIGVAGHSMGGVAGGQFCVDDRRCKAGPQPRWHPAIRHDDRHADAGAVPDGVFGPAGTRRRERHHLPPIGIEVLPRGRVGHDAPGLHRHELVAGSVAAARGAYGAIEPKRAAYVTRQIVREFFDQELRGRRSPLLAGETKMPDVTVKKVK